MPRVGIEPTAVALRGRCSTVELHKACLVPMEVLESPTVALQRRCSTSELHRHIGGHGRTRTCNREDCLLKTARMPIPPRTRIRLPLVRRLALTFSASRAVLADGEGVEPSQPFGCLGLANRPLAAHATVPVSRVRGRFWPASGACDSSHRHIGARLS